MSPWDQRKFDTWQASLSPERRAEDQALLNRILEAAAEVPTLKEELAWAKRHGIKFFVDRTAEGVAGYYTPRTGVLGISAAEAEKNFDYVVGTLGHEIRHAWQDCHALYKYGAPDFSTYFISDALIEADAFAYGERVRDEYKALKLAKEGKEMPETLQKSLADKTADLKVKFFSWYENPKKTRYYGNITLRYCASRVFKNNPAKKVTPVDSKYEFKATAIPSPRSRLNVADYRSVLQLGQGFSGYQNYMTGISPEDWFKKLLRPALAFTFWGAVNDEQRKMAVDVRKENARTRLAEIRAARLKK